MSERDLEQERRRSRVFGWWSLLVWATSGLGLDALHALRVSAFLDQPLRRELLAWGHAHGVGLSLVVLAYAAVGVHPRAPGAGRLLHMSTLLMPLGFVLGVIGHSESDPGPAVMLVPIGAVCLVIGLFRLARASGDAWMP